MKWKFWKKEAPPPRERKAVLGTSESTGKFLQFGYETAATAAAALSLYDESTAVSVPVNLIAENHVHIEPILVERATKNKIVSHPVLDLLQHPSSIFPENLFREKMAKELLITGDTGIVAIGNIRHAPLELRSISPTCIQDSPHNHGYVKSFMLTNTGVDGEYKVNGGDTRDLRYYRDDFSEFHLIRNFSTLGNSMARGESPLKPAAREARQHIQGNAHNLSILKNGGTMSLVFHYANEMLEDEFEELQERIRASFSGERAGEKFVVNGEDLKIQEFGKTNKDMDFSNLFRIAINQIALQYRVPLPLITTDAATLNNYQQGILALYDGAVIPVTNRIFAHLSLFLLPRFGLDPRDYAITYDPLSIPALRMRMLEEVKLRSDINVETDNELRASMGLEEHDKGNIHWKPANLVDITSEIEPLPLPSSTGE